MIRMTQFELVRDCIERLIAEGITDKREIYDKVEEELGVPRSTVRRCTSELKNEYLEKIVILENQLPGSKK